MDDTQEIQALQTFLANTIRAGPQIRKDYLKFEQFGKKEICSRSD